MYKRIFSRKHIIFSLRFLLILYRERSMLFDLATLMAYFIKLGLAGRDRLLEI